MHTNSSSTAATGQSMRITSMSNDVTDVTDMKDVTGVNVTASELSQLVIGSSTVQVPRPRRPLKVPTRHGREHRARRIMCRL